MLPAHYVCAPHGGVYRSKLDVIDQRSAWAAYLASQLLDASVEAPDIGFKELLARIQPGRLQQATAHHQDCCQGSAQVYLLARRSAAHRHNTAAGMGAAQAP